MNTFKTYLKVNSKNNDISFAIAKMEDIYAKHHGKADEPHRHHYFTVLIIKKSAGLHKIDFNSYPLAQHQIYFVAPGQVHQIKETAQSFGYVMTFSNQFLVENSIPLSFIDSLNLFQNYGQSPPLEPSFSQFNTVENYATRIFELFHGTAALKYVSIGAYLKLMLIECNAICAMNPISTDSDNSGSKLIRAFKTEVDLGYKKEHSTKYYADKLHITSDHLNRTVKSILGRTAKEYIQTRIITEAKRLLYFTDESNKEIAYELGFTEPANFSAFFKKHTQISPSNFKKKEHKASF